MTDDDLEVVIDRIASSAALVANHRMSRATVDRVAREMAADVELLRSLLGQEKPVGDD